MKRLLILLFVMFVAAPAIAAFIDYNRVTTYTDGSAIPAAKVPTIQYRAHYGPSSTGPWTAGGTAVDNLAIAIPDPAAGGTLWYTVDATLDGKTSGKAAAKSITTPFGVPGAPLVRGVR